jgi:succinate dehydrogenase/fumarate reductase flavoprotein subunit
VVIVGFIIGTIALIGNRGLYDQIGRGGLSLNEDSERATGRRAAPVATSPAERDEEIRQMLEARNDRRRRQGKEPLDIETELARLTAPVADPGLEDEVRQLVIARNMRRQRQGKEPLDVEQEVARQLRELGELG